MKNVLYTQRVDVIESYQERRDCADQRIPTFIWECGYLPIAVPNLPCMIYNYVDMLEIAGIVLTGGNSLEKYGGNAAERDETDCFLIKYAVEHSIPLYGFCRGMQSILDYFGMDLLEVDNHVAVKHWVDGISGKFRVNSYHNQGIKEVSQDFVILSRSQDGVVESIKHRSLKIYATMWHPERVQGFSQKDIKRVHDIFN